MKVNSLSHVQLFVIPWAVAHQAPPSIEFSRQEYWSGLPFPSPLYSVRNYIQYLVITYNGKYVVKEYIYYMYNNHFAVYQKLTQLCKQAIVQF